MRQCVIPNAESRICTDLKKSVLEPSQKIEFLGMVMDSIKMEISLPQDKLVELMSQCKQVVGVVGSKEITIMDVTKLIGNNSDQLPKQYC